MPGKTDFLFRVNQIANEQPKYEIGHDGSDGACDCIGLVKGALKRAGFSPGGLSGTNYAARNTVRNMKKIVTESDLKKSDVVLKSRDPDDTKYDLPEKYRKGGKQYNGDLRDYYHIGVVTGVHPLKITHMTTPTAKVDTKIGKWNWCGQLPQLPQTSDGGDKRVDVTAKVKTPNGGPVNVRAGSGTSFKLVGRIPCGAEVRITLKGDRWSRAEYQQDNGMMLGWVMNEYLVFDSETASTLPAETITLTLTVEQARAMLAGLEALEDQIVDRIGRG